MDWSALPQFGTVGILTVLLVNLGKARLPSSFRSDNNVWWAVAIAVALQSVYTIMTGGHALDVWSCVPAGATIGLSVAGIYRGISGSSKTNSIDLSEQVNANEIAGRIVGDSGEDVEETKQIGFKTK